MISGRRRVIVIVTAIGVAGMLYLARSRATTLSYSALPFQVNVADAETGSPIEGVIVAAVWHLETRGGRGAGFLNVTEAVTDANGVLKMPGWGPLEVRPDSESGPLPPRLSPDQPWLVLFKSGYSALFTAGEGTTTDYLKYRDWTGDPIRTSYWDGKTIKLKRFVGNDLSYLRHLSNFKWAPTGACMWTKAPRMTAALIRVNERLKGETGWSAGLTLRDVQERDEYRRCGSVDAILGPFLK